MISGQVEIKKENVRRVVKVEEELGISHQHSR